MRLAAAPPSLTVHTPHHYHHPPTPLPPPPCHLSLSLFSQPNEGACVPDQWGWPTDHAGAGACAGLPPANPASRPLLLPTTEHSLPRPPMHAQPNPRTPHPAPPAPPPSSHQYYYLPVVSARSLLWPGLKETRAGAGQQGLAQRAAGFKPSRAGCGRGGVASCACVRVSFPCIKAAKSQREALGAAAGSAPPP